MCDSVHLRAFEEAMEKSIKPMMRNRMPCRKGSAKPRMPRMMKITPAVNTSIRLISFGMLVKKPCARGAGLLWLISYSFSASLLLSFAHYYPLPYFIDGLLLMR